MKIRAHRRGGQAGEFHHRDREHDSLYCSQGGESAKGEIAPHRAFTLIELLVVMAVIAILAGLLLPALGRAKERAQSAGCLNHLRQLQIGFHLYADDNADQLSPSEIHAAFPDLPRWVAGTMSATNPRDLTELTNRQILIAPGPGHIGPYVPSADVFHCPGDRSRTNLLRPRGPLRVRSYSMNNYVVGADGVGFVVGGGFHYSPTAFLKWSDFNRTSPGHTWIFIDEHELTINTGAFGTQWMMGPSWKWSGHWPARRHGGRGALSFADGHGELPRWREPTTGPPVKTWEQAFESGFETGNRDYAWLWERTNGPWPFPE